jgi:hypothetical protein
VLARAGKCEGQTTRGPGSWEGTSAKGDGSLFDQTTQLFFFSRVARFTTLRAATVAIARSCTIVSFSSSGQKQWSEEPAASAFARRN